jgi:hypothetical protein
VRYLALAAALTATAMTGCSKVSVSGPLAAGQCENKEISEAFSSDRAMKAVSYTRRCGSAYSNLNVSVLPTDVTPPDAAGNALVEEPPTDGKGHESRLELVWEGPRQLRIAHNPEMRLRSSSVTVSGVTIEHATVFELGT